MDQASRELIDQLLRQNIDQDTLPSKESSFHLNPALQSSLTPLQARIINDSSRRIALLLGRRTGKSWALVANLFIAAHQKAASTSLFLSTSREHAKRLCWHTLKQFNDRFNLNATFNNIDLVVTLPNGSRIIVNGVNNRSECEKYRGDRYACVCIDESSSFGEFLNYLLRDVLSPALADLDGKLLLSGTPNASCTGEFYRITTNSNDYTIYRGDVRDNPAFPLWKDEPDYIKKAESFLEEKRNSEEWKFDQTSFKREWLAQWIRDETTLIIPFSNENIYRQLPEVNDWHHIIGIDFGTVDPTAITIGAFTPNDPNLYIVHTEEKSELSYEETCNRVLALQKQYQAMAIVADPNPGKIFIQDLNRQYGLPIRAADKRDKAASIKLLAQDFASGRIKIAASLTDTIEQLKMLSWNDKKTDIRQGQPDHIFDSLKYMHSEARHHWGRTPDPKPSQEDIYNQQARQYEQRLIERLLQDEYEDELNYGTPF